MTTALQGAFAALPPIQKVTLLTRLVHAETERARGLTNPAELLASNELVHGITAYVCAILDERRSPEQDVAILQALAAAPHLLAELDARIKEQAAD
ncbi:hypothetical protein [Ferrovibrio sp.]|uniref:hypothetical protein n=1 Tax=Ferrovibrio sp. TaxID=1917215 RepID=UPI00311F6953